MALSVVKYPHGYFTSSTVNTATVSSSSGALFTLNSHGMSTGDFIYIYSSLSAYNGYWYVEVISANTFKIREYATKAVEAFVNSGTVYFYISSSGVRCFWHSVHLPIIYKLQSTLWPINGVDTARTITTFSNYNGYTYINAVGDIKSTGTASSLESVVLSGTSVDGIYKIINWFSDTNFVINLPYSAANVLSSGTVQYYYLNYHARIRVYAGLDSGHFWAARKPYELIAELRCIPDSTGLITVNVADYVKQKIEVFSNDLQQDELPNDIDSWCEVKISYAESYDDSNMYTVSELVGSYTEDATSVFCINAKPQFQSRGSGAMIEHTLVPVTTLGTMPLAKFLTPFATPTLFAGKFWDISYINAYGSGYVVMKRDLYRKSTTGNYSLISSTIDTPPSVDYGVYRYTLAQSAALEDRIDLTVMSTGGFTFEAKSETKTIYVSPSADCHDTTALYLTWKNYLGGQDYWSFTAQKLYSIDILESKTQDDNIYTNWPKSYGEFGQSINKQTVRRSKNMVKVSSQYVTKAQLDAIAYIVTSPLVQILTTNTVSGATIPTLRTVIVDASTLKKYQDRDHLHQLSFTISYTDEIGVQEL